VEQEEVAVARQQGKHFCSNKSTHNRGDFCYKYNIEKLQDPGIVQEYTGKIEEGFRNLKICQRNEQSRPWGKCRQIISEASMEVIGER
jgi:hypothetical protein